MVESKRVLSAIEQRSS